VLTLRAPLERKGEVKVGSPPQRQVKVKPDGNRGWAAQPDPVGDREAAAAGGAD